MKRAYPVVTHSHYMERDSVCLGMVVRLWAPPSFSALLRMALVPLIICLKTGMEAAYREMVIELPRMNEACLSGCHPQPLHGAGFRVPGNGCTSVGSAELLSLAQDGAGAVDHLLKDWNGSGVQGDGH